MLNRLILLQRKSSTRYGIGTSLINIDIKTKEPSYHLLVHWSLVMVYTVQLMLQHNLRQGVIEELSGKQCHEVLQRGSDVFRPFEVKIHMDGQWVEGVNPKRERCSVYKPFSQTHHLPRRQLRTSLCHFFFSSLWKCQKSEPVSCSYLEEKWCWRGHDLQTPTADHTNSCSTSLKATLTTVDEVFESRALNTWNHETRFLLLF